TNEGGEIKRSTPLACADWLPLSAVSRQERDFLARLSSSTPNGRIFGTLVHRVGGLDTEPLPGIRIMVNDGKKTYAGRTDAKGQFDIPNLPAGTYLVTTSVPNTLLVEADDETIDFAPHGCFETYL